jgi:hypothetical protein
MSDPKRTKAKGIPKVNVTNETHDLIDRIGHVKGWNKLTTVERIAKAFADTDPDVVKALRLRRRVSASA